MKRTMIALFACAALMTGALACEREGPMERTGERIDEAVDEITHPDEGPLEEAGRKADETIDDMQD